MQSSEGRIARRIIAVTILLIASRSLSLAGLDTNPLWRRVLGGEIDGYPAQGPGGHIYVVADDRALHSIDPLSGKSHWIYRPGGRLLDVLMVAPDGTIYIQNDRRELFAVTPGGTGRWKLLMQSEAAALPTAAPDGRLLLPLKGGRILCISRKGNILWKRDESANASAAPVVDSRGTIWMPLTDGRIIGLDVLGNSIATLSNGGVTSILALDFSGRLWAGGYSGGLVVYPVDAVSGEVSFTVPARGTRVAAIFTDMNNDGLLYYRDGTILSVADNGRVIAKESLAVSGGAPSLSRNGTFITPISDGSIHVIEPSGGRIILRGESFLSEPLITEEGLLIAGGGDWILYGWQIETLPGLGWTQFRGGPRRSGTFDAEPVIYDRIMARKQAGFLVRERMALSENISERMELMDELEAFSDEFQMYQKLPWAGLLIQDLASSGTVHRSVSLPPSVKSMSLVRERAYRLLGKSRDHRARYFLQKCLRNEDDTRALAIGFLALGNIGADWEGSSLRLIADRYQAFPSGDDQLTLAATTALVELIRYNGGMSDPVGFNLIDRLVRNASNETIRRDVLGLIRIGMAL